MEQQLPKLRFPQFKENWKDAKLKDISNVIDGDRGINYPNGEDFTNEGYCLFLNAKNVTKRGFIFDNKMFISKEKDSLLNKGKLTRGDIILTTRGSVGNIAYYDDTIEYNQMRINSGMVILRVISNQIDGFFFYYLLNSPKIEKQITTIAFGSAQPQLTVKEINKFSLIYPTQIQEQYKITSFLILVDKQIELLELQRKKLALYKKGAMQKLFSQQIRFKDDKGNDFPEWKEKKLGDIGKTYNGLTGKTKEHFGKGKQYIQYMQIFSNSKIQTNNFGLVEINKGENQSKVQYGDVFFTTSSETPNEIGTTSVLLDNVDELYLNSFCFGFRPDSLEELVPAFAQFLFRSPQMRDKIIPLAQGSTRFNMSKVELMKITIGLPTNAEQLKISSFLSVLDFQIEQLVKQLETTKLFKKGLLQQMFV
ncbi:restriction endonuclease subunit S [Flavobacterium aquidurense]|uniref:restriction endonuclease subunit S n=1 Tax=Flavobacterium aquidurense TaxID=362413 RepID=UPI0037223065